MRAFAGEIRLTVSPCLAAPYVIDDEQASTVRDQVETALQIGNRNRVLDVRAILEVHFCIRHRLAVDVRHDPVQIDIGGDARSRDQ